jgi:hypothetical protein
MRSNFSFSSNNHNGDWRKTRGARKLSLRAGRRSEKTRPETIGLLRLIFWHF